MEEYFMFVLEVIIFIVFALIGWIFKMVFSAIKEVEKEHKATAESLQKHKLHAAETYATKVDVDKGFDRVMNKLDSIDDKLDNKADKTN